MRRWLRAAMVAMAMGKLKLSGNPAVAMGLAKLLG